MIEKFRKIQNSWLIKLILIITALSFMSLFGITGYIGSAANNKPVIRVDDIKISKDAIAAQLDKSVRMAQNLLGDTLEIDDNMRNAMLLDIVNKKLVDAVITKVADDNKIYVGSSLIRKTIQSQPEFKDYNGSFDLQRFNRFLSSINMSEKEYVAALEKEVQKQFLLNNIIAHINMPEIVQKYAFKIDGQEKVFKYIKIVPAQIKISRGISDEELEQYYQDFAPNFTTPETRDISYIVLNVDNMAKNIKPTDEEIAAYYEENVSQFKKEELRKVLQMVFDTENEAKVAKAELNMKKDFVEIAEQLAKQTKETTNLGEVTKDMLIADLAEDVFKAPKGAVVGPLKSEMGWHILKITAVKPAKITTLAQAKNSIIANIQKENAYDNAYDVAAQIEDGIGAGKTLEEIAKDMNVTIATVKNLSDTGEAQNAANAKKLLANSDFVEAAFSYNNGEISQVLETEDGFAVVRVDHIYEAKLKDLKEVKNQIVTLWQGNERNAIAQENINDVTHDLESGDSIDEVAKRFGLEVKSSGQVRHDGSFEKLSANAMDNLFKAPAGKPVLLDGTDMKIIAVNTKTVNRAMPASSKQGEAVLARLNSENQKIFTDALIGAYGSDYKVKVRYNLLGLAD